MKTKLAQTRKESSNARVPTCETNFVIEKERECVFDRHRERDIKRERHRERDIERDRDIERETET
jgi:hypothetical protein